MSDSVTVGSRVAVNDPGLAQLRAIMRKYGHEPADNHVGVVDQDYGDSWLIVFDDTGSAAPYPKNLVSPL